MTHINNTGWLIIRTSILSLISLFPGLHVLQVWQSLYRSYHLWLLDNLNYNNSSPAQVSLTILSNIKQPNYNNYRSMLLTYTWNEHMIIWHQYKIFWTINYNIMCVYGSVWAHSVPLACFKILYLLPSNLIQFPGKWSKVRWKNPALILDGITNYSDSGSL